MVRVFAHIKIAHQVNMPRRKKKEQEPPQKKVKAPTSTYHKSKNGRYYKKTKNEAGKCTCRFVSKKEAEDNGL